MAKIRKFAVFILPAFILSLFLNKSFGQSTFYEEVPRTFYGGLVVGTNFSQIDGDRFAGYRKIGLNAGGIVYARLSEHIAASMEILFSQKGSRAHKNQESPTGQFLITKHNINLNYAEVPVQINYFDKRRAHFSAGLSFSQLISAKETATSVPPFPENNLEDLYPFKKIDINALVGFNLNLVKGLFLNARFQYSIIPLRTNAHPELARIDDGKIRQFSNMYVLRLMYIL